MTDNIIRTVVVDDSVLYRKVVRDVLADIPDVEVVAVARDGVVALQQIELHKPDLITLDVAMPNLDGLGVLREMRKRELPGRAIMISASTWDGSKATLEALQEGAFDFVVKPSEGGSPLQNGYALRDDLSARIDAIRTTLQFQRSRNRPVTTRPRHVPRPNTNIRNTETAVPSATRPARAKRTGCYAAVAIGISTGGPDALRQFLPKLPQSFPLPIIVAQHMPPVFTRSLAESLDQICELDVSEATDGDSLEPGRVLVAPGGMQTLATHSSRGNVVRVYDDNGESLCHPSVDILFGSMSKVYGAGALGVIMTGMGRDGNVGCHDICNAGGSIIAQDEDSCVVFGMPQQPIADGLASSITPLHALADELQQYCGVPAGDLVTV